MRGRGPQPARYGDRVTADRGDWPLLVTGIAGAIILATDYSSSYQDALRAVLEYNERSEAAFENSHPAAP